MKARSKYRTPLNRISYPTNNFSRSLTTCTGQALVEFTLCFVLLVIIAWIPADFGMMFYTSHVGQNAAREGARVAAADPTIDSQTGNCTMPCSSGSDILQRIAKRMAAGLMTNSNTTITLATTGGVSTCDKQVSVRVQQVYYPFFYKILRFMGFSAPDSVPMDRTVFMRYEHQC